MPPAPSFDRRAFTAWLLSAGAAAATGCAPAALAPRNPAEACRAGAPAPLSGRAPDFPCWPEGLAPENASVYVENDALTKARPDALWAWLTRADLWTSWFPRAKNVRFEAGGPRLAVGSVVVWEMLGATIRVTVTRADAPYMLAWEGGAGGVHAYHAWLLRPEVAGTRIVTVETERGPVPELLSGYLRGALKEAHEDWVHDLAEVAAGGPPPG